MGGNRIRNEQKEEEEREESLNRVENDEVEDREREREKLEHGETGFQRLGPEVKGREERGRRGRENLCWGEKWLIF